MTPDRHTRRTSRVDPRNWGTCLILIALLLLSTGTSFAIVSKPSTLPLAEPTSHLNKIGMGVVPTTSASHVATTRGSIFVQTGPLPAAAAPTFRVLLSEQGIPSGTNWTTTVTNVTSGVSKTVNNGNNPHTYNEPNGSYTYRVSSDDPDFATPNPAGAFTMNGTQVNLTFAFQRVFRAELHESGLPPSTTWSATVRNATGASTTESTATDLLVFTEPNGTYTFRVPADLADFLIINPAGSFNVSGSPVNLTINFDRLYHITMYETGLPPATTWTGIVGNSTVNVSANTLRNLLVFLEPNGTYWYEGLSSVSNFATVNQTSQLVVNGTSLNLTVQFQQIGAPGGGIPFTTWFPIAVTGAAIGSVCIGIAVFLFTRRRKKPTIVAAPSKPAIKPWDESVP